MSKKLLKKNSSSKRSSSKYLIVANTKAYIKSLKEFYKLQDSIWENLKSENYKYYIAAPSSLINQISKEEYNAIIVGAQNFETEENSSLTGANTLENIIEAGAKFTLLGHSEIKYRDNINNLLKKSISLNFMTILCVGENTREGEENYEEEIKNQLKKYLNGVDKKNINNLVVAYEPLWAVGAPKPATAEEAQEAIIIIRRFLVDNIGIEAAKKVKVLYGGAVDENNALSFIKDSTADGVLVGRACMNAKSFAKIVNDIYSLN